ncbi:MAG: DUF5615 family PIN-like protein [Gemmatimonadota bacterium]|jgi:predicted nuclease of predicted toxin-antitoxin system|nr:DUF5615 family PIN-like protein [Gemmatimonadota bacterium]
MARLLLDENIPHTLRRELTGHEVRTVQYMGWAGKENGELLRAASGEGFDAIVTFDKNIPSQQNLAQRPMSIVIIDAPGRTGADLSGLVPELLETLGRLQPGRVYWVRTIDCAL